MKLVGEYKGISVYSHPDCPSGFIYMVNDSNFDFETAKRKDGSPDMRFSINKLQKLLNMHENI